MQTRCDVCHKVWMRTGKVFAFRGAMKQGEIVWAALLTETPADDCHVACDITCASVAMQQAFQERRLVEVEPFWEESTAASTKVGARE